jgi:hypothetical protein
MASCEVVENELRKKPDGRLAKGVRSILAEESP